MISNLTKIPLILEWGLYIFLFAIPFHSVLVFPDVSIVKAIALIIAPIWFIWMTSNLRRSRLRWNIPRQNLYIIYLLIAFIISIFISAFYGTISPSYYESLITILLDNAIVILIYTSVLSEIILRRAFVSLILGGSILGILIMFQFIMPEKTASVFKQQFIFQKGPNIIATRAVGPFRDPNYAALLLIVLACLSFFYYLTCQKRLQRKMFLLSFFIQIIAIFLTFSRGGYLILVLISLTILLQERRHLRVGNFLKIVLIAMIGLIVFVIIFGGVVDLILTRAATAIEFAQNMKMGSGMTRQVDQSSWIRLQLIQVGIKMFIDNFPLGIGWENFRDSVSQYAPELRGFVAHNTYISVSAELGLPGFIAYIWLIMILWRIAAHIYKVAKGKMYFYAKASKYSLLAILIGGFFLNILHEPIIWLLIGMIMAQNHMTCRLQEKREE
jgi:O-antigen ligase